jgi:hypothetical protein
MEYKQIEKNSYPNLTNIHLDAFHGFFLSSLGEEFLNTYYRAALASNKTIAVCAIDEDGNIHGFGTGCVRSGGYHLRLIRNNIFKFLYQGLIILFTNPKGLWRLIKNLDKISNDNDDGNYAELI